MNNDDTIWCILIHGDNVCLYHEQQCLMSLDINRYDNEKCFYDLIDDCVKTFKREWCRSQILGIENEQ